MRPRSRRGTFVVEALVALVLALMLLTLALTVVARQRDQQAGIMARLDEAGALRVAHHLLAWELRSAGALGYVGEGPPGPADSVALRAVRGVGRVCAVVSPTELLAAVRGIRLPDATKDSVVVVADGGVLAVRGVLDVVAAPEAACDVLRDGERAFRFTLSDVGPEPAVLVIYFERGSYHLALHALRYRRGGGGRQPVTPEVFATPASAFVRGGAGRLEARLVPRARPEDSLRVAWGG